MKTKALILSLLCILFVFTACNKSDDDQQTPGSVHRIKTITHGTHPESDKEFYAYDSSGRLKSITITGHAPNQIQYTYLKDKIVVVSEIFINLDTLYLNDKGLVESDMFGSFYEYDAQGYCIKTTGYGSDEEADLELQFRMSEGNTTDIDVWENINHQLMHRLTHHYEYLPNSVNTIGVENRGVTFYGKQDKNLLSVTTDKYIGSDFSDQIHYRYEIDAKNRVLKKWIEGYPESADVYTYYE